MVAMLDHHVEASGAMLACLVCRMDIYVGAVFWLQEDSYLPNVLPSQFRYNSIWLNIR